MLLSTLALLVGSAIGRLRGGSLAAALNTRLHGKGFLVLGIGATLIVNLLEPANPMIWHAVSIVGFFAFAFTNLALTGMIVLTVGMLMNFAALLANGAVPVADRALESVGQVDSSGEPVIEGVRESTSTATRLVALGDIVPVPFANKVVSLGDLVILVALADIVMNIVLRSKRDPDERADDKSGSDSDDELVIDLRDEPAHKGPAHSAGIFKLTPPLPRVRRPSHAAEPAVVDRHGHQKSKDSMFAATPPPPEGEPMPGPPPLWEPTPLRTSMKLSAATTGPDEITAPAAGPSMIDPPIIGRPTIKAASDELAIDDLAVDDLAVEDLAVVDLTVDGEPKWNDDGGLGRDVNAEPQWQNDAARIDLTDHKSEKSDGASSAIDRGAVQRERADYVADDPEIDLTDRRPIIDLTVSPSDEQLAEFLRRRAVADQRLVSETLAPPSPGHRRNRTRRRQRKSAVRQSV